MYEVGDLLCRLGVMVCVALQYFVGLQGILDGNHRNVGLIGVADEENESFLSHKFLIVAHTTHTMM